MHYFPAYEMVAGAFARGQYFAKDLRTVTEAGMDHVMAAFLRNATEGEAALTRTSTDRDDIRNSLQQILSEILDEDGLVLAAATRQDEVAGWDSVNHMKLLFAVEAELGVHFGVGEHGLPETVDEMVDMIQRKLRS